MLLGAAPLLDAAAAEEQVALELPRRRCRRARPSMICSISGRVALAFSPMHRGVDRHLAPAVDVVAEAQDLGLDDGAAAPPGRRGRCAAGRPWPTAMRPGRGAWPVRWTWSRKKSCGTAHGCRRRRRSCRRRRPRRDARPPSAPRCRFHHLAPRLAVDGGDQADAAGVVLGWTGRRAPAARSCAFAGRRCVSRRRRSGPALGSVSVHRRVASARTAPHGGEGQCVCALAPRPRRPCS